MPVWRSSGDKCLIINGAEQETGRSSVCRRLTLPLGCVFDPDQGHSPAGGHVGSQTGIFRSDAIRRSRVALRLIALASLWAGHCARTDVGEQAPLHQRKATAIESQAYQTAREQSAEDHNESSICRLSWHRARKRGHPGERGCEEKSGIGLATNLVRKPPVSAS